MDGFFRTGAVCFGMQLVFVGSLLAQVTEERQVAEIRIAGLKTISPATVRQHLARLPEIYEASHASIDRATYVYRVQEAIKRGMLASGFFDARVSVVSEDETLEILIEEGPRIRCGSISVSGGTTAVNHWAESQLQIASELEEDAKPAWRRGKPAVGSLFGLLAHRNRIQKRLDELGFQGSQASVDLQRNAQSNEQELRILLSEEDAGFVIPVAEDPTKIESTPVSAARISLNQSVGQSGVSGLARELDAVHQRLFARPSAKLRFRQFDAAMMIEFWFGQQITVAKIGIDSQVRHFVWREGELLISMSDPLAAISLPVPNTTLTLTQQSPAEAENGKTTSFTIGAAISSKPKVKSAQMGVVFTSQAWADWFPPDEISRTENEQGVAYRYQEHQIRLDHAGNLIDFVVVDAAGRKMECFSVKESEIEALADNVRSAVKPLELLACEADAGESSSGERKPLKNLLSRIIEDRAGDDEFHIPPANGQRDVLGVLVLMATNEGELMDPDSVLGQLCKLYALELSGNRRGTLERVRELEHRALRGPLLSLALADFMERQGHIERALQLYRHSQQLLGDLRDVRSDIRLVLNRSTLPGRVFEEVDVKEWLRQVTLLASPILQVEMAGELAAFLNQFPDATNEEQRLANAEQLLILAYELRGKTILHQHTAGKIKLLQAAQIRSAKKQDSKDDKKSKR
ncbi:MAG: hypothetical protein VYA84_07585 [Planctomycetota bacterium]|nr:hypothetical protein [Planctomycetota bacterium]